MALPTYAYTRYKYMYVCMLVFVIIIILPVSISSATSGSDTSAWPLSRNVSSSLKWGTFRPNLYFGMRTKQVHSPLFGLLWFDADDAHGLDRKH